MAMELRTRRAQRLSSDYQEDRDKEMSLSGAGAIPPNAVVDNPKKIPLQQMIFRDSPAPFNCASTVGIPATPPSACAHRDYNFASEEEAFQSPSSTTLRFLVPVLPDFFLKVSPTLSTNSEGNALHALKSRLSDPTNVLQSWDPILVNPCTCRLINNKLRGPIPKGFTTVSNLKVFDSSNNDLCETIPSDPRNNK
ncbi:hypothetical protein HHK36_027244 [Tetracentron sinense]|uniref:Leucine-rich repeat-containing N-terminal plant-type domain-containing protein n=1 Tax=Tetracentron sinense TaxID=13715 RepID=A0A834YH84_TETSI|nr:hypothetical protein HHK36_027244 [Tetracentron sinense]